MNLIRNQDKSDQLADAIAELIFSGQFDEMALTEVLGSLDLVHHRILTCAAEKDS